MPDDPDPPRKFYDFKPPEFERANEPPPHPPPGGERPQPGPDPGVTAVHRGRIDVRELARIALGGRPPLGHNAVANRPNEVHGILRANLARDNAAGLYHVSLRPRRSRRLRDYLIVVVVLNTPLGLAGWLTRGEPIALVLLLSGFVFFNVRFAWHVWAIMDDY